MTVHSSGAHQRKPQSVPVSIKARPDPPDFRLFSCWRRTRTDWRRPGRRVQAQAANRLQPGVTR